MKAIKQDEIFIDLYSFYSVADLHFVGSANSLLSLRMHSIQGVLLREIPERTYGAGQQQVSFPLHGIPAGVYVVTLESGGHRNAVKVVLGQ